MKVKTFHEIKENELAQKRLAKIMVLECFRNTFLEDLHAGKSPSSKKGDYSDVKVVSSFGEISWTKVSRFNDAEMKILMKEVVNNCYTFLYNLFCNKKSDQLVNLIKKYDIISHWDEPLLVVASKINFDKPRKK